MAVDPVQVPIEPFARLIDEAAKDRPLNVVLGSIGGRTFDRYWRRVRNGTTNRGRAYPPRSTIGFHHADLIVTRLGGAYAWYTRPELRELYER